MLCCCSFIGHRLSPWRGSGVTVSCENSLCHLELYLMDQINTLIHCFLSSSLSHAGRLKERTASSSQTAVSTCGSRLIAVRNASLIVKYAYINPFYSYSVGRELQRHHQPVSSPWHGAIDKQWEVWNINFLMFAEPRSLWTSHISPCLPGPGALWWSTTCSSLGTGSSSETDRSVWG